MSRIDGLIEQLCPEGVEVRPLATVATYIRGVTYSKSDESDSGPIKVLRSNNITVRSNTVNFHDVRTVMREVVVRPNQWLRSNDILMSAASGSRSHVGKVAFIRGDIDYCFGGFMAVVRAQDSVMPRFLFHLLTSKSFSDYLDVSLSTSTINNLSAGLVGGFEMPIPPIAVQEEIVQILDSFDALVNDLSVGLPAEIAARRKQYEYYRDKLLSFEGLAA